MRLGHRAIARAVTVVTSASLLGAGILSVPAGVSAQGSVVKRAAHGETTAPKVTIAGVPQTAQSISPGTLAAAGFTLSELTNLKDEEADAASSADVNALAISDGTLGCRKRNSNGNERVNQDCTFRRQAEELIKINPTDSRNIIAGQNDSRIGYNKCGFDFSFNDGRTWGDGIPPFYQRENHPELDGPTAANPNRNTLTGFPGTAHTYDAGSDPALTFDSEGRAFFSCVLFDVHTNASGLLVTQSPKGAGGSFYDNVSPTGRAFVVVEDSDSGNPNSFHRVVFHDKEFIAADAHTSSPNRDNVYVTWTVFDYKDTCRGATLNNPTQCSSAIYGSMSTDHAVTWSTPEPISGASPLCFFGNAFDPSAPSNACNNDQGADPQPMPDGSLAVIFNNGNVGVNTPTGIAPSPNLQQLAVVCHPSGSSTKGTAHLNCGSPARVGDDIALGEPQCDFGRGPEECIPGPWIRTNDFPRIGIDPSGNSLLAVWQDYRNGAFDIQISHSDDGGHGWEEAGTVNSKRGLDFYMPAVDVGNNHRVAVSFYGSERVTNENATPAGGFAPGMPGVQAKLSAYYLSGHRLSESRNTDGQSEGTNLDTPFEQVKISPDFAPPDGAQAGFNGDYSGLAVSRSTAHPIWSDTRNTAVVTSPQQGVVHDEDIFTDDLPIPD